MQCLCRARSERDGARPRIETASVSHGMDTARSLRHALPRGSSNAGGRIERSFWTSSSDSVETKARAMCGVN
jgi:hypothetical protein